jgi:hypothetical protein
MQVNLKGMEVWDAINPGGGVPPEIRDGNSGTGTGTIFYPWVAPVPDPNRDGYGTGIFSHPRVTRRVPDTLLPL